MISLSQIRKVVAQGLRIFHEEKTLIEGVVYGSCNRRVVGRLVYTSHLPCQGLQEPKSDEDYGVSVQGYFKVKGRKLIGFGQVENEISLNAVKRALKKARANAIFDPDFHGFPEAERQHYRQSFSRPFADTRILGLSLQEEAKLLSKISFQTLEGALTVFQRFVKKSRFASDFVSEAPGGRLIVSGDNFLITEKMAIASTKGMRASEESAILLSFISAMLEKENSKGRGWQATSSLKEFSPFDAGKQAALGAVAGIKAVQIPSGKYSVIFGPQAVTELFAGLLLPSFSAAFLDFNLSLFNNRFGRKIASELLTIYDDAAFSQGAGSKLFTDEGYQTAKIPLVKEGKFVGILMNDYYRKKLLCKKDEELQKMVGDNAWAYLYDNLPRSGFRFASGGGRSASAEPGISATNLFIASSKPLSRVKLFGRVKNGIYIGSLWYTYPIAGYKAGEITGTAVADTFLIKNGRISQPIQINSLRLRANLRDLVKNIIGISKDQKPTILWASDEITYAPEVAIGNVQLETISAEPLKSA